MTPPIWQNVPIKGYLCQLSPGHDLQWIKETYGGGRYLVNKKRVADGRFIKTKSIDIAGSPRVEKSSPEKDDTGPEPSVFATDGKVPTVNLAGVDVPLTGDVDKLKDIMLFLKVLKTAFPDPPDYNQILLSAVIEAKQDDFLGRLATFRDAFPDAFGGSGQPTDTWPAVIMALGEKAEKILSQPGQRSRLLPGTRRVPTARMIGPKTSENTEKSPGSGATDQPQKTGEPMSMRELATTAVAHIIAGFRLDPPKDPPRVVGVIDQVLQLVEFDARQALNPYRNILFDMAENELTDDFADDDSGETRTKFKVYFDSVFDEYVREDRQVVLM